jgi:hypothetical protein
MKQLNTLKLQHEVKILIQQYYYELSVNPTVRIKIRYNDKGVFVPFGSKIRNLNFLDISILKE